MLRKLLLAFALITSVPGYSAETTEALLRELGRHPVLAKLREKIGGDLEMQTKGSNYRLAYSLGPAPKDGAYLVGAWKVLENFEALEFETVPSGWWNSERSLTIRAALAWIESRLRGAVAQKSRSEPSRTRDLARDFLAVYDLRYASGAYSGLPFFSRVSEALGDPEFMKGAEDLHRALVLQVSDMTKSFGKKNAGYAPRTVYELALGVTGGDSKKAVRLLGILLSRDTSFEQYFARIPHAKGRAGIRTLTQVPVLVRLMTEIDQAILGSAVDRLSFDGVHVAKTRKHYYFWSAAFVAQELSETGYAPEDIRLASVAFSREYKRLRRLEYRWGKIRGAPENAIEAGEGFGSASHWPKAEFMRDFREVSSASGRGAAFGSGSFGAKSFRGRLLDDCAGTLLPEPEIPTRNGEPLPLTEAAN
jgi:hypothetical protein